VVQALRFRAGILGEESCGANRSEEAESAAYLLVVQFSPGHFHFHPQYLFHPTDIILYPKTRPP
jgi:hypothetical protein